MGPRGAAIDLGAVMCMPDMYGSSMPNPGGKVGSHTSWLYILYHRRDRSSKDTLAVHPVAEPNLGPADDEF